MVDLQELYRSGIRHKDEGNIDAAWSIFLRTLHLLELVLKQDDSIMHKKLKFDLLCGIGGIQQKKNYLEEADKTFFIADSLRAELISKMDIPPIPMLGLLKWQKDYEMLTEFFDEEQHYAVLAGAKQAAEEIEQMDQNRMTRNHWRLLMKIYDMISSSYTAIDEPEKSAEYDEKVEDIAFIHGFDRFS